MSAWVWWIAGAVILGVIEIFTVDLIFGMISVAALVAGGISLFRLGLAWELVAFCVSAIALLVLVRPIAKRHLRVSTPQTRTGVAALVGKQAVVVERVDANSGRVKLDGEIWSARAYDPTQAIEPGSTVDVMEIDGATALVYGMGAP